MMKRSSILRQLLSLIGYWTVLISAIWYERDIALGWETNVEMRKQVEEADIILPLLSPKFFASDAIDELVRVGMRRSDPLHVSVIPVLMRPMEDWQTQPF